MDLRRPLAVVTPTLDGDVLARLALADASFTAGQLRRLMPEWSTQGIRNVLNRLARQGIVTAESVTETAVAYRLNRDHLAAPAVIALASLRASLWERLEERLVEWEHPPAYAAVFGSWARGEATETSDIDIFLVQPSGAPDAEWDAQVDALETDLTRWTGNDARALVQREDEIGDVDSDPVLAAILDEGRRLVGSDAWFRQTVRAQRADR